jgi:hypothetical protein
MGCGWSSSPVAIGESGGRGVLLAQPGVGAEVDAGATRLDATVDATTGSPEAAPPEAAAGDALSEAGPTDAGAEAADPDASLDASDASAFQPWMCLADASPPAAPLPDGGADADAAVDADAATDAACTPTAAAMLPQVLAGEVAPMWSRCGVDGGAPPLVGAVPGATSLGIYIGTQVRNDAQFEYCAQQVNDPNSPVFRDFLTDAQLTAIYFPTDCDYQALIAWVQAQGLTVTTTYDNHLGLDVTGTASAIDAAFHVTLNDYLRPDGTEFYGPDRDPSVDLGVPLSGVSMDSCRRPTDPPGP